MMYKSPMNQPMMNGNYPNNSNYHRSNYSNNSNKSQGSNKVMKYKIIPKKAKPLPSKPLPSVIKPKNMKRGSYGQKYGNKFLSHMQRNSNEKIKSPWNQKPRSKPKNPPQSNGHPIESLFTKQHKNMLSIPFDVPSTATKQEVQKAREQVNDLYDADGVALENWYDEQLRIIDEMIANA